MTFLPHYGGISARLCHQVTDKVILESWEVVPRIWSHADRRASHGCHRGDPGKIPFTIRTICQLPRMLSLRNYRVQGRTTHARISFMNLNTNTPCWRFLLHVVNHSGIRFIFTRLIDTFLIRFLLYMIHTFRLCKGYKLMSDAPPLTFILQVL